MASTLKQTGEDGLIKSLIQLCPQDENVIVGPGDDCAVLAPTSTDTAEQDQTCDAPSYTLLKTDTIIEGVHYLPDADPFLVGWKAVARVVSDFAAMAGTPEALVVALTFKPDTEVSYLEKLYQGMAQCAEQYAFSLVGGETSSISPNSQNVITISGTGKAQKFVTRSGAKPGDSLYVTGTLGGSIAGKHLNFQPRVEEALWLVRNTSITAMMDLSDGIAKDLHRLADLSEVGFELDLDTIPTSPHTSLEQALSDGEDYELLFTLSEELSEKHLEQWAKNFPELPLTKVGRITESGRTPLTGGWEHFTSTSQ